MMDRTPDHGSDAARSVRVYVNERGVSVSPGSTAVDAVAVLSTELGEDLAAGRARLTDSRGLPIESSAPVHGGLILRVLPVRESARGLDGTAEERT
ncbi:MAG: hypothetical protein V4617_13785 [Gemmatimonadota bacterium]